VNEPNPIIIKKLRYKDGGGFTFTKSKRQNIDLSVATFSTEEDMIICIS
jgi:hypothetical protein